MCIWFSGRPMRARRPRTRLSGCRGRRCRRSPACRERTAAPRPVAGGPGGRRRQARRLVTGAVRGAAAGASAASARESGDGSGGRGEDEVESGGAAAANEGGADAAIEALSTSDGAGSDDVAPEDPRAEPQSIKGLAKPIWKRPVVIGGAAAVLAASLPAIVLFSSPRPPRPVAAEPGMEASPIAS